jgi:PAS domain S-box-containing protein
VKVDQPLRVLHLEDNARDAELVRDLLEAGGVVCDITRVQTREEFVASLQNGFDVILADYSLPSFDGMSALKIAALRSPDVPFIFVSGALGEELAIEALKTGATDYVLKERPSRLVPSVQRALREARERIERKRTEEALRVSETRFRTFVDRATDAFFLMDEQVRVVDVNRQACDGLGWSREELIGMHLREFDVVLDEASFERLAQRARTGEIITFETRHRRKDGTTFPIEIRTGTFEQAGKLFHLALARDISERKQAEEKLLEKDYALQMARTELARVSRLTTLGELTTSIAHEVSQPLGAMVASAGACARWLAADPPAMAEAHSALDNIVADGKRAREVIARIRALTKRQLPRMDLLDLNRKISDMLALTEYELRSQNIVLRTQLDRTLPGVMGDRVQLQQVLLNLVLNAIDAMSGVHDRPRELTVVSRADGSNAVLVEVGDSGVGLDPDRVERVFDAFYTTKAEGLGIGLSISRSIVEAHGGRLCAAPNEPHGAVFRFSLPVAEDGQS